VPGLHKPTLLENNQKKSVVGDQLTLAITIIISSLLYQLNKELIKVVRQIGNKKVNKKPLPMLISRGWEIHRLPFKL